MMALHGEQSALQQQVRPSSRHHGSDISDHKFTRLAVQFKFARLEFWQGQMSDNFRLVDEKQRWLYPQYSESRWDIVTLTMSAFFNKRFAQRRLTKGRRNREYQ